MLFGVLETFFCFAKSSCFCLTVSQAEQAVVEVPELPEAFSFKSSVVRPHLDLINLMNERARSFPPRTLCPGTTVQTHVTNLR